MLHHFRSLYKLIFLYIGLLLSVDLCQIRQVRINLKKFGTHALTSNLQNAIEACGCSIMMYNPFVLLIWIIYIRIYTYIYIYIYIHLHR